MHFIITQFYAESKSGLTFWISGKLFLCKNTSLHNSKRRVLAILPKSVSEALGSLLSFLTSHFSLTCYISEVVFRGNVLPLM